MHFVSNGQLKQGANVNLPSHEARFGLQRAIEVSGEICEEVVMLGFHNVMNGNLINAHGVVLGPKMIDIRH